MKRIFLLGAIAALAAAVACGGDSTKTETIQLSPTAPSNGGTGGGGGTTVTLTAPTPQTPTGDTMLPSLRPTLTVRNGTSSQTSGTRTYEFLVSDRSDFSVMGATFSFYYAVVISRTGVAEDPSGTTSFTPDADLQPATRFYWRARMTQGTVTSDWSSAAQFRTKVVGYNRPGELYDPLVYGETIGERVGTTSFVPDKGLRLDSETSFVRYRLPQTVTAGEFSMEVEGLRANIPVISGMVNKPKIFGMQDGDGDYTTNAWRIDGQYRGIEGNPANCIQFRAMFGGDQYKIEPDTAIRYSMVFLLDPSKTYFWKGTWDRGFRMEVREGGVAGNKFYDQYLPVSNAYAPGRHVAYLGAPRGSGGEMSVIVGAIYRNVWLGAGPRPASLGSALLDPGDVR